MLDEPSLASRLAARPTYSYYVARSLTRSEREREREYYRAGSPGDAKSLESNGRRVEKKLVETKDNRGDVSGYSSRSNSPIASAFPLCPIATETGPQNALGSSFRSALARRRDSDRNYVVEGLDRRRKSSVHAEKLAVDQSGEREVVEDVGAVAPDVQRAELLQALVVEPVDLRDLPALVVASNQHESLRVFNLNTI